MPATLPRDERLRRRKVVERMFASGARSLSVYPLRVVYMPLQADDVQTASAAILVSVPKRRLRHAVDRNRVKRLIREAYRLHKAPLTTALQERGTRLAIAFLYQSQDLPTQELIHTRVRTALARIAERLP